MESVMDPFVLHVVALILTPVFLLIVGLLWVNAREVRRLTNVNAAATSRMLRPVPRRCMQPTYIACFMSAPSLATRRCGAGRSPLLVADDSSTYSCFADSLVAQPWLLTPEDSAALDNALNFC